MSRMSPWKVTTDPKILRRVGKTAEELCEAGAVCARIVIQGIDEIDPSSGKSNRQRLLDELADVQAQINCTRAALLADPESSGYFEGRTQNKMANMADWESQMDDDCAPARGHAALRRIEREEVRDANPEYRWTQIWTEIIVKPDGSIDVDQLKKELCDFSTLISFVPHVYEHVTGGRVTKPLTWPSVVCSLADERVDETVEEALNDERRAILGDERLMAAERAR